MEQQERNAQNSEQNETRTGGESQSGEPGRTPGSAEGDRETVEEDLERKQK